MPKPPPSGVGFQSAVLQSPHFQEVPMPKIVRRPWLYLFLLPLMIAGALTVTADPKPQKIDVPAAPDAQCDVATSVDPAAGLMSIAPSPLDGSPAANSSKCCDPALEPGVNGNPLCFEG